jgi:hydroxymethylpyrimidine/phosphomethylpyrimidine kinase
MPRVSPTGLVRELIGKKIDTSHTHGTGCTLASALACRLGQGMNIDDAFADAVRFVRLAILEAPGLGQGHGPLGQQAVRDFWDEDEM